MSSEGGARESSDGGAATITVSLRIPTICTIVPDRAVHTIRNLDGVEAHAAQFRSKGCRLCAHVLCGRGRSSTQRESRLTTVNSRRTTHDGRRITKEVDDEAGGMRATMRMEESTRVWCQTEVRFRTFRMVLEVA